MSSIEGTAKSQMEPKRVPYRKSRIFASGYKTNSGEALNREWDVGARHALYHKDGTFYMPLERFPGAYFDTRGYVLFKTEEEYLKDPNLTIGERVNVREGISSLPGYVRKK